MTVPRGAAVVVDGGRVLVIRRFVRFDEVAACAWCRPEAPACPGHHYAVLPGGHVEAGESAAETAVRELAEETSLTARVDRLLHTGLHRDREASYFVMAGVAGTPVLGGEEVGENSPDNSFTLAWATPDEFTAINLFPADLHAVLTVLLNG